MSLRSDIMDALADYDAATPHDESVEAKAATACVCVEAVRDALEAEPAPNMNNPIAQLQEMAEAKGIDPPDYRFKHVGDVHAPVFKCTCMFEGCVSEHTAPNKQKAKRRAAAGLLDVLIGKRAS